MRLARGTGFKNSISPHTACLQKTYLQNAAAPLSRRVILTTADGEVIPSPRALSPARGEPGVRTPRLCGEGDARAAGRGLGARAAPERPPAPSRLPEPQLAPHPPAGRNHCRHCLWAVAQSRSCPQKDCTAMTAGDAQTRGARPSRCQLRKESAGRGNQQTRGYQTGNSGNSQRHFKNSRNHTDSEVFLSQLPPKLAYHL